MSRCSMFKLCMCATASITWLAKPRRVCKLLDSAANTSVSEPHEHSSITTYLDDSATRFRGVGMGVQKCGNANVRQCEGVMVRGCDGARV